MSVSVLSLIVAFFGYSLHNISQAGQKIGLARFRKKRAQGALMWALATAGTSVAFFITLGAISLGSISLVGAMAGTGLISLAIFSHFVMREQIDAREVGALAVIAAGGVLVGLFANAGAAVGTSAGPLDGEANIKRLWGILAGGSIVYAVTWFLTRKMSFTGAVVGGFSGFLGAYSQLFQEHGTASTSISQGIGPFFYSLVTNPITLVWIGLSVVSMLVLQFAYRHGRAIEIIPSFTGNFIVVPVVGGVVIFGQSLVAIQWIGVLMIVAGSIILGRGQVEIAAVGKETRAPIDPAQRRPRKDTVTTTPGPDTIRES